MTRRLRQYVRALSKLSRKVRNLRMVILLSCNNDCHHAITDTVTGDASQVLVDLWVWGCTLLVYLKNNVPQHRKAGTGV